ncbi:MAG: hypothetical protein ACTSR2_01885, partial [Candidatus Hodarchaeales archaeon]
MKYTLSINQLVLSQYDLDIKDAAILDYLIAWCQADDRTSKQILVKEKEGGREYRYTWINYNHLIREMPLLKIKQKASISTRIKKLSKVGFIKTFQAKNREMYIRLTEKIKELHFGEAVSLNKHPVSLNKQAVSLNKHKHNNNIISINNKIINTNSESKDSLSTKKKIKRKDFRVPSEVYKEITDAYQKYKEIKLSGAEFGEVKRAIKTMLYSGRTKEDIIRFMRFCHDVCERIKDGDEEV